MGSVRALIRRVGVPGFLAAATLGPIAYFALFACAPQIAMRPATPMTGNQQNEFGMSASGGLSVKPGEDAPPCDDTTVPPSCPSGRGVGRGGGGQVWLYHQFRRWADLGMVIYVGGGTRGRDGGFGLGPTFRFRLAEGESFRLALDLNGGWLWGELGLPLAWRLARTLWMYASPSVGVVFGRGLIFRTPVGLSIPLDENWSLLTEFSPQYVSPEPSSIAESETRGVLYLYAGLGATYRF